MVLSKRQTELLESAMSQAMWAAYCTGQIDLMLALAETMKTVTSTPA
jgi:hypothetical protein